PFSLSLYIFRRKGGVRTSRAHRKKVCRGSLQKRQGWPQVPCMSFDPVEEVLADLRRGRVVIVTDDADRENEGDLIFAAEHATPELVAFMVRYTSGVICVPME